MRALILLLLLLLLLLRTRLSAEQQITTQSFKFARNFSSIDMVVRGLAQTNYDSLTLTLGKQGGSRAVYRYQAQLLDPNNSTKSLSFNTSFVFQILGFSSNEGEVADGIVFLLAPASLIEGNATIPPEGTCLSFTCDNYNSNSNFDKGEHLFGVEYDTFMNYLDPDGDHIGIDINSVNSSAVAQLHNNSTAGHNRSISLHRNMTLQSWIEYRGDLENIKVWLAENGSSRPSLPHIDYNVNLQRVILPTMYVGFSAASGQQGSVQTIYDWSFAAEEVSAAIPAAVPAQRHPPTPPTRVSSKPKPRTKKSLLVIPLAASIVLITLVLSLVWLMQKRRRRTSKMQRRSQARAILQSSTLVNYSYKELYAATRGFKNFIGKGGSCKVYKGLLTSTGSVVAVKSLTDNAPSQQQFLSELNVISRVRHQNLISLKGWCHEDGKLLLVYEYMSAGSLDKLLFSAPCSLSWNQRYAIIKSVAEGLAYLHEGLEQRIIHRDVKAANVLLDEHMNAKLGDFGLARFIEPRRGAQTLTRAGTSGYISPELAYTGRASESSDVYSFGILVFEIIAGRPALDFSLIQSGCLDGDDRPILLDWVWKLYQRQQLMNVVDPNVVNDAGEQAMVALRMGLLCCSLAPSERPTMRKCCQVFGGESQVPSLQRLRPAVMDSVIAAYGSGFTSSSSSSSAGTSSSIRNSFIPMLPNTDSSGSSAQALLNATTKIWTIL